MKRRSLETRFWKDSYIQSLPAKGRYLFNYLLMNEYVNIIHIYELTENTIAFETGLIIKEIQEFKRKFEIDGKFIFRDSWIKIVNADKYEHYEGETNEKAKLNFLKIIPSHIIHSFDTPQIGEMNIKLPRYKSVKGGYKHRLLAEDVLGRKLTKNEVVHHLDKNPSNNSLSNLVVMSKIEHKLLHKKEITIDKVNLILLSDRCQGGVLPPRGVLITNNQQSIINKYNNIEDIKEEDLENIAEKYQVPISFVKSKLDDMSNWLGANGKKYKDYYLALCNWVKKDALKIKQGGTNGKFVIADLTTG